METKTSPLKRIINTALAVFFATEAAACTPLKDGTRVTTTQDTTCWQFPGNPWDTPYEQENKGTIPAGTEATVQKGDDSLSAKRGFKWIRIEIPEGVEFIKPPLSDELSLLVPVDENNEPIKRKNVTTQLTACWVDQGNIKPAEEGK